MSGGGRKRGWRERGEGGGGRDRRGGGEGQNEDVWREKEREGTYGRKEGRRKIKESKHEEHCQGACVFQKDKLMLPGINLRSN